MSRARVITASGTISVHSHASGHAIVFRRRPYIEGLKPRPKPANPRIEPDANPVAITRTATPASPLLLEGGRRLDGPDDGAMRFLRDDLRLDFRPQDADIYLRGLHHVITCGLRRPDDWKSLTDAGARLKMRRALKGRVRYVNQRERLAAAKQARLTHRAKDDRGGCYRTKRVSSEGHIGAAMLPATATPWELLEAFAALIRAVASPTEQRLCAFMQREGCGPTEAAKRLGINPSTWSGLVQRATRAIPEEHRSIFGVHSLLQRFSEGDPIVPRKKLGRDVK